MKLPTDKEKISMKLHVQTYHSQHPENKYDLNFSAPYYMSFNGLCFVRRPDKSNITVLTMMTNECDLHGLV